MAPFRGDKTTHLLLRSHPARHRRTAYILVTAVIPLRNFALVAVQGLPGQAAYSVFLHTSAQPSRVCERCSYAISSTSYNQYIPAADKYQTTTLASTAHNRIIPPSQTPSVPVDSSTRPPCARINSSPASQQVARSPHNTPAIKVQCETCTPPANKKTLVDQGRWLREQGESLVEKAEQMIFAGHNPDINVLCPVLNNHMRIDLHNQYKPQAAKLAEKYVRLAQTQSLNTITFIVGKGIHSPDNIPKIKPHVMATLKRLGMNAYSPDRNPGQIVVKLRGQSNQ
jgi:hypothetical protein